MLKGFQKDGKCNFTLVFANTVLHDSTIHRKRAKHSLVSRVYYGPTMVGPGENFQNGGSLMAGKRYFKICFANTVYAALNYKLFQLFNKHYVAFKSSKLPDCNDAVTQVYLNFLKF